MSGLTRAAMEAVIRRYYDGCNEADEAKMIGCFTPDAVHYFPPGMYEGPFRGAATIATRWRRAVETLGSWWTIDRLVLDEATAEGAIEWSHFKTRRPRDRARLFAGHGLVSKSGPSRSCACTREHWGHVPSRRRRHA